MYLAGPTCSWQRKIDATRRQKVNTYPQKYFARVFEEEFNEDNRQLNRYYSNWLHQTSNCYVDRREHNLPKAMTCGWLARRWGRVVCAAVCTTTPKIWRRALTRWRNASLKTDYFISVDGNCGCWERVQHFSRDMYKSSLVLSNKMWHKRRKFRSQTTPYPRKSSTDWS